MERKKLSHLRVWMYILNVKCNYMSQEILSKHKK